MPFPSPGDLPDTGIEPRSPALQADSSLSQRPGKPNVKLRIVLIRGSRSQGVGLIRGKGSLVSQMVKNLPAMRETWVRSLGWEDPLEKGKATHSSILAWRIPQTL